MSGAYNRLSWDIGLAVLTTYDSDGFIGVQYDAYGEERSGMSPAWLHHSYGRVARPLDADGDGGCTLLYAHEGAETHAWLAYDRRVQAKIPVVSAGGQALYDSNGSFLNFDPETRTVALYVPYADDKAHLVTVGKDANGKAFLELASGTGLSVRMLDDVLTLTNADGSSYATLDGDGFTVFGPFKASSGADLGGPTSEALAKFAALSAALSAMSSLLTSICSGAGTPGSPSEALAPFVATQLAAMQAAVTAFGANGTTLFTKGA